MCKSKSLPTISIQKPIEVRLCLLCSTEKCTKWKPSKLQYYWDRLEYREESWRLEETCSHSNSSEKPSANAGVKNSKRRRRMNNNNNDNNYYNFIEKNMKNWRIELTAGGKSLAETKIQRGIFQGDVQSPLLFIIADATKPHTQKMHGRIQT